MDLDALLSALQTTQQKKSSVRLSERNVVELVMKLKQLGLVGEELLHTINGKEYITTARLKTDIQAALRQEGGRLELTELPALVGVDLVHCEKQAALIVAESGGSVIEAQGELITTQYFETLAAEINELLQESGVLSLADLAVSYALSSELLRSTITARLGRAIAGQLEAGLLYTPAYVRNIKAQLRGALRGTAAPVGLPSLLKELGLDGFASSGAMVASLVEELLAEGAVRGSTRGGAGSWVPAAYTAAQQGAVLGFYRQNGWVAYEHVRKAGISNEKAYMRNACADGTPLDTVFVSPSLITQADASVEEALSAASWLDVSTVLPPLLGPTDVAQLLDKCGELARDPEHKRGQVLATTCVVSAPIIAAAKARLQEYGKQQAEAAIQERRRSAAATSTSGGGPDGGKAAGSKKGAAAAASKDAGGDDSDDDWSMGGGKKGKKGKAGGGGGAKTKAGKAGGGANVGTKGSKGGGGGDAAGSLLSLSVLTQQVLQLYPDMEDAGLSGGLARALAELLSPAALAAHQEALAAVFTSTAEARRRAKDGALKALDEGFTLLQLYERGTELCREDEATHVVLQRHLLRSTGADALDQLLTWCSWEFDEQEAAAAAEQAGSAVAPVAWTPASRSKLVKGLPPDVGQPLGRALEAANGADVQEFAAALEAAAQECSIRLRRLDKKAEKAALASQKARLMGALEPECEPAAALALALPLLALKVGGKLVSVPGRAIAGLLAALQPSMEEADFSLVQQYHGLVVDSLKAAARAPEAEGSSGAAALDEQLHALLPRLKALVGIGGASS